VNDGLLILLAVTCDQQRSAVGPVIHCSVATERMAALTVGLCPSNTATRYTSTLHSSRSQIFLS